MRMIFKNKKEFEMFYHEIKRSLFQLNFDDKYETIGIIGSGKTGQVFKVKNNSSSLRLFIYNSSIPHRKKTSISLI
jgi:hypothetical protein